MLGIDDPELAAWVAQRLTPHPLLTYAETIGPETNQTAQVPRSYIHCTEGPIAATFDAIASALQTRGWPIERLRAPHDAMLTNPVELARMLRTVASGLAGSTATLPRF